MDAVSLVVVGKADTIVDDHLPLSAAAVGRLGFEIESFTQPEDSTRLHFHVVSSHFHVAVCVTIASQIIQLFIQ